MFFISNVPLRHSADGSVKKKKAKGILSGHVHVCRFFFYFEINLKPLSRCGVQRRRG